MKEKKNYLKDICVFNFLYANWPGPNTLHILHTNPVHLQMRDTVFAYIRAVTTQGLFIALLP